MKSNDSIKPNAPKNGRAADSLADKIAASILANELKAGDTLPAERDLMEHHGMSRTVVREAIAQLASRGLIISKPRHRPVVQQPDMDSALGSISGIVGHLLHQPGGIKNLFDTRIMLEAILVREAAIHANKDHIRQLREALEANETAIEDTQQFYTTDVAFHAILYAIPGNPVLTAVHKAYTNWLASHWKEMPKIPERNRVNYQSHQAIFNGIINRDPDEAETALRNHLIAAWKDVKETFQLVE